MFTGIVEEVGRVVSVEPAGGNRRIGIKAPFSGELKVDQSVAHNGVCLTVEEVMASMYFVTAVEETLRKTNLGNLRDGDPVNLERCMVAGGRLDGHIVQGHVDQTAVCTEKVQKEGSWEFAFQYDSGKGNITVEKGSIAVDGVSLTVFNSTADAFSVAIIPYTHEHTTFRYLEPGAVVNLEFDILGKYVQKLLGGRGMEQGG